MKAIQFLQGLVSIITLAWQNFLDSLDSSGGHILLFLILIGASEELPALVKHQEMIIGGLLLILKTTVSNKSQQNTSTDKVEVTKEKVDDSKVN